MTDKGHLISKAIHGVLDSPKKKKKKRKRFDFIYHSSRAVVSGGAGGTLAPPEFGSSINPIPTRGGRLCPPHY